jgi:hypothetical protein
LSDKYTLNNSAFAWYLVFWHKIIIFGVQEQEVHMEALLLERIHKGLLQNQESLTDWVHTTPLGKKNVLLGPLTEQSVHVRLDVIDDAISKAESKT